MEKEKILLTPSALALRWSITVSTLSQWRWNGDGPPYLKMGKQVRYDLKEIEKFEAKKIRQNTSQTESPEGVIS